MCVICGLALAQAEKPKVGVLIEDKTEGREMLLMAVNNFLIQTGRYQMIALDAIDLIGQEHERQMSGSVSDADIAKIGEDAGAEYVCVVTRSQDGGVSYVSLRMVKTESKVAVFADMAKLPPGAKIADVVKKQINLMHKKGKGML
jgi:hypothetical protein